MRRKRHAATVRPYFRLPRVKTITLLLVVLFLLYLCSTFLITTRGFLFEDIKPSNFQSVAGLPRHLSNRVSVSRTTDGCGIVKNPKNIRWRTYNAEDWEMYNRIEQCINWYDRGAYLSAYNATNFRRLDCNQQVDPATTLLTLQKYHTIYILGDSVLQQQFIALMCTIDPKHENVDPIGKLDVHLKDWYFFNYSHPQGVTQFKFFKVGLLFDMEQKAFFKTHFPDSIKAATANDAIILHVGGHYRSGNAQYMMAVLKYMSLRSFDSLAPMFLVEPNIEEWPTRNGLFSGPTYSNLSDCQPLTEERMLGRGQMVADLTFDEKDEMEPVSLSIFHDLYPGKEYESVMGNETYKCYPDCTPQKWRLDMVRRQLAVSNIHIVPVWWQMAALNLQHGIITARKPGDCIHKDISTLISMNDQLVRTMMKAQ
ncbi:hypothetical protein MHU86_7604 [Fragilaria crotonensis]|nr:hypothetical protein MHU86_7604 [Fragilaria crotonensis]